MQKTLLTVQEAAKLLGVSSSTVKRLCQTEAIPVIRTPGGHRRIDKIDLNRIAPAYHRTKTNSTMEVESQDEIAVNQVLPFLLDGKPFEVARLFSRFAGTGLSLIVALENGLIPALWKIGQMWRDSQIDVYQEHICTNAALTAIDILSQQIPNETDSEIAAVGGSFIGCPETLASKMVALGLKLMGFRAVDIGGLCPPKSLARAAEDFSASFVWVTHTHVVDVDCLIQCHNELKNSLPPSTRVIVGGGGLSPAVRRSLPWCTYYETISGMAQAEAIRRAA